MKIALRPLKAIATLLPLCAAHSLAATGPEYLENAKSKDPIVQGLKQFKLPFTKERKAQFHFRSYLLDRDNASKQQDWVAGGFLQIESTWSDELTFGTSLFTSNPVINSNDKGDSGLLKPGHHSYNGMSELYLHWQKGKWAAKAGRYIVNMPYVNKSDIRMIYNTFQGAHAVYKHSDRFSLAFGSLSDIKTRTSTSFKPLYKVAGLDEEKSIFGGSGLWHLDDNMNAGAYFFHAPDYLNNFYFETNKTFQVGDKNQIKLSGQYTHQSATGDKLDDDFTIDHYGARLKWTRSFFTLLTAATYYAGDDKIRKPWGSIPGYTSAMVIDFDRAGEHAYLLGGVVDFSSFGLPGLEFSGKIIKGKTDDKVQSTDPDTDETDLNLVYNVQAGYFQGAQIKLRHANINYRNEHQHQKQDFNDLRMIVNYTVQF